MKQVELNPQFKKPLELNPKNEIIELSQVGGVPYVELRDVTIPDWYNNSHVKILSGIYTGNPSSIRIRDHYPHSIGSAWCYYNYYMNYSNFTTYIEGAEYLSVNGIDNWSVFKEHCFWGARNKLYDFTAENYPIVRSMKYDVIPLYKPAEDNPNYYADRIGITGVEYPYGQTPSSWITATLDRENKTWTAVIPLNQFTMFEGTAYRQDYLKWQLYHPSSYPKGLNYDPRLHPIEVEINGTYNNTPITGARMYYLWHVPQYINAYFAPKIEHNTGIYTNPSKQHNCYIGPGVSGNSYAVGYSASGGNGSLQLWGNPVNYQNILFACKPKVNNPDTHCNRKGTELIYPQSFCIDDSGNFYIYDTDRYVVRKYNSSQEWVLDFFAGQSVNQMLFANNRVYISNAFESGGIAHYDSGGNLLTTWTEFNNPIGLCSDSSGNIYVADSGNYKVKKLDTEGNVLLEFGSSGSGDGQFTVLLDVCVDSEGNIYTSDVALSRIQKFDSEGNFVAKWTTHSSYYPYGLTILNNILYVSYYQNGKIGSYTLEGADQGTFTINYPLTLKNDNEYIYCSQLELSYIGKYDISFNKIDQITKRTSVWRQGDIYGIIDLNQIQNAYAVYQPNNFDPTDAGTYTEMQEYNLEDLSLDDEGYVNFPILNNFPVADPTADFTIYIKANFERMGQIDTQYSRINFNTGGNTFCPGNPGNQRTYTWMSRYPTGCSQVGFGSTLQYCNRYYTWPQTLANFVAILTENDEFLVDLEDFDAGEDLDRITKQYNWFDSFKIYNYGKGNDGNKSKFWVNYDSSGAKKDYNDYNDATGISCFGTASIIHYHSDQDLFLSDSHNIYGFELPGIALVNRNIKNGSEDTVGFSANLNITRKAV